MAWNITIISKDKIYDPNSIKLEREVFDIFNKKVNSRYAISYIIEGDFSEEEIKKIAENLIVDPIIEDYFISYGDEDMKLSNIMRASRITIKYKKGVLNPNDEITFINLKRIIGERLKGLYTIHTYYIEGASEKDLENIANKILANRLLHEVKIEHD
ncbi:MAG TPA: hypothetical protein VKU94_01405 [Geobacterales bacterium]|nr:hypothetical protein [Geobacterales bacterium]